MCETTLGLNTTLACCAQQQHNMVGWIDHSNSSAPCVSYISYARDIVLCFRVIPTYLELVPCSTTILCRSRTQKTSLFFLTAPHYDGPPFVPLPTSDANPPESVAAPHPGDATYVVARSDSADGGSAGTILGGGGRIVTCGVMS